MKDNLDKHRRYVEILKEIKEDYNVTSYKIQALQYFIGMGNKLTSSGEIRKILSDFADEWTLNCYYTPYSKSPKEVLDRAFQAILTSLTGEVINAKQD